jgi:hypothetical protein
LTPEVRLQDDRGVLRARRAEGAVAAIIVATLAAPLALAQTPAPTLPPPVAGKTVNLKLLIAPVTYKVPGAKSFVTLTGEVQVPIGTTVNTDHGRVNITSAADLKGGTNKSWFYDGTFKIGQAVAARPVTQLTLTGPALDCGNAAAARPKKRKLWGLGSGAFSTRGQFSAATVRGTKWVVEDNCQGTLTRVVHGVVAVRDFVRHKTILLRAGEHYLAKKK